ncbi:MAG TPA: hypothetical protein VD793_00255 [Gemmatimonadales bacterium]|nr:hypothetical protein [Gemmatimonadales bacterium]
MIARPWSTLTAFAAAVSLAAVPRVHAAGGSTASAEPHLAMRTGLKCSACHVNRSGGGGRSAFGSVYAQTQLPWKTTAARNRALNDYLALGFDVRTVASGYVSDASPRTSIDLEEANVYMEARLIDRVLALYVDQTLGPGRADAREAFALVEQLPLNGYAKAGKFLLPYGLRLQDDLEFIRQQTGFSYDTPDQGVELGIEPGPLSWILAVTNGSSGGPEGNSGKQLTSSAALVFRHFRLGASASHNELDGVARRRVFGGFGGARLGPLTLLGEVDRIEEVLPSSVKLEQDAAYVAGDLLLTKGVSAKVTYGYFDKSRAIPEDERVRWRFGLELFPAGFARLAAFYTADVWIPQATADRDRISLEFHLHF